MVNDTVLFALLTGCPSNVSHGMRNAHWPMTLGLDTYYVALCFQDPGLFVFFPPLPVILVCGPSNTFRDLSLAWHSSLMSSWFHEQKQSSLLFLLGPNCCFNSFTHIYTMSHMIHLHPWRKSWQHTMLQDVGGQKCFWQAFPLWIRKYCFLTPVNTSIR